MAYNEFAYFYDEFNGEADYDALYEHIQKELAAHGIADGIVADLGCGTGELTLMLTQAGYDMIGIDQSEEMLCVVRDNNWAFRASSCSCSRTCSSSTYTVPSGVRCPLLTRSTTSRTSIPPLRMRAFSWKRAASSSLI